MCVTDNDLNVINLFSLCVELFALLCELLVYNLLVLLADALVPFGHLLHQHCNLSCVLYHLLALLYSVLRHPVCQFHEIGNRQLLSAHGEELMFITTEVAKGSF